MHTNLNPKNYSIVHDFSNLVLSLFYVILINFYLHIIFLNMSFRIVMRLTMTYIQVETCRSLGKPYCLNIVVL